MSMWKDKKRKVWIAKFWYQKKPYKKEGFKTKSAAQEWEASKKAEIKAGATTPSVFFQALATKYLKDCQLRFQINTWRTKSQYYHTFMTWLHTDVPAKDIPKHTFTQYLQNIAKTKGTKTANRHLKELKALYNWAIKEDLVVSNLLKAIESYAEDEPVKYVPPAEDISKVLLVADQDDWDLLIVLYDTGARISEILRLTWNDVSLEHRWVQLWTRKRKSGGLQSDKLRMTNRLYDVLYKKWKTRNKKSSYVFCKENGVPYTKDNKRYVMRRLCRRAQIKEFGFHAIRHHVASILMDSGKATLGQIQKFLRHRRKTTTENYLHEIEKDLTEVAKILDERNSRIGQENGQDCIQKRS